MTIAELLDKAIAAVRALPYRGDRSPADRDLSLAITHIEDAQMRVERSLSNQQET